MRDEIHSKNPKDTLESEMSYPKHYDIEERDTAEGRAEARRKAYGEGSKQDDKAIVDY